MDALAADGQQAGVGRVPLDAVGLLAQAQPGHAQQHAHVLQQQRRLAAGPGQPGFDGLEAVDRLLAAPGVKEVEGQLQLEVLALGDVAGGRLARRKSAFSMFAKRLFSGAATVSRWMAARRSVMAMPGTVHGGVGSLVRATGIRLMIR